MFNYYRHRHSRRFHLFRHGSQHFLQHRRGERHKHSRRDKARIEPKVSAWMTVPARVWPKEIVKQILLGTALAFTALFAWAAIDAYLVLSNARGEVRTIVSSGISILEHSRSLTDSQNRAKTLQHLSAIEVTAYNIDNRLSGSAALSVLSWIPVVGTQVSAVRQTAADFDVLCQQATDVVSNVSQAANSTFGNHVNIPSLANLNEQLGVAQKALSTMHTSTAGLIGPVRSMREQFAVMQTRISGLVDNGHRALTFALDFFGGNGPRRYFVAGLNSAEMRDQGAVLSWSLMDSNQGTFHTSSSSSVGALTLTHPAAALSGNTAAVFGPFYPTRIWQSVNAIANFPTSATWMTQMYAQARHQHVDGVVALDTQALRILLEVTGPIYVPAVHSFVGAGNVESLLLHDLYVRFPAGADQQLRHADVSAVATAVIERLSQGGYDPARLIFQLAGTIPGRHLMLWDARPELQRSIEHFGASGQLNVGANSTVHVSVQSGVAAKLDWFVRSSDHISIQISNDTAYITSSLTIRNDAPLHGHPSYALGPDNVATHTVGQYVGRIYQWWPSLSQSPGAVSEEGLALLRDIVRVNPQQSSVVVSQLVIPHIFDHGNFTLSFVPQGRIHPMHYVVTATGATGPSVSKWFDTHPVSLTWTK